MAVTREQIRWAQNADELAVLSALAHEEKLLSPSEIVEAADARDAELLTGGPQL